VGEVSQVSAHPNGRTRLEAVSRRHSDRRAAFLEAQSAAALIAAVIGALALDIALYNALR
jgi:hypothetical protein